MELNEVIFTVCIIDAATLFFFQFSLFCLPIKFCKYIYFTAYIVPIRMTSIYVLYSFKTISILNHSHGINFLKMTEQSHTLKHFFSFLKVDRQADRKTDK